MAGRRADALRFDQRGTRRGVNEHATTAARTSAVQRAGWTRQLDQALRRHSDFAVGIAVRHYRMGGVPIRCPDGKWSVLQMQPHRRPRLQARPGCDAGREGARPRHNSDLGEGCDLRTASMFFGQIQFGALGWRFGSVVPQRGAADPGAFATRVLSPRSAQCLRSAQCCCSVAGGVCKYPFAVSHSRRIRTTASERLSGASALAMNASRPSDMSQGGGGAAGPG